MSKRILVVEDQEDNRQILRDLLSNVGYEMIEAVTGEEGVSAATNARPDLILMDIQRPMDGYEATRCIKSDPSLAGIPIIAVTSYALTGDEDKALAAGCDAYVPKPYSPRELLAKIRAFLPSPGARARRFCVSKRTRFEPVTGIAGCCALANCVYRKSHASAYDLPSDQHEPPALILSCSRCLPSVVTPSGEPP